MKNTKKVLGITVVIIGIIFCFTACGDGGGGDQDIYLSGNITISPSAYGPVGTALTAIYSGTETVSYQWKKDGANVGTNSNKFTPMEEGKYTVTVSAKGYKSKTSAAVTVTGGGGNVAVTNVTLNQSSLSLTVGGSATLTAAVMPDNATNKNVTWSSSNANVAGVNNGVVTAVEPGTAAITVTTADGGRTATCAVTVTGGGNPNQKTTIVFDNTGGICAVSLYDDYRRRDEDKIAEVPAGRLSDGIEYTPGDAVPFYFLYTVNLKGVSGFTLNYVPQLGKDQIMVRINEGYATTIPIPKLNETVSSPDQLLSNMSYLLIQNNSSFTFILLRGSSIIMPDYSSSSLVNSGERARYTINPGAVSPYQLLAGADYNAFPGSIAGFEAGRVYSFVYDGNVSLISEVEIKLENVANNSGESGGGVGGSTFTITGIPSQYNGKYILLGLSSNEYVLGFQNVNMSTENITLCLIKNGSVSLPMWDVSGDNPVKYSGNITGDFYGLLYNTQTFDANTGSPTAYIMFSNVTLSNGGATRSWSQGQEGGF